METNPAFDLTIPDSPLPIPELSMSTPDHTPSTMTPREIVAELDKHIIGQASAKRAVAIALRNRWRRQQVAGHMRGEIHPKNILMIGPTGVGKTELAKVLASTLGTRLIRLQCYEGLDVNADGTVDLYIGPKAPKGKEVNWIPTREGEYFYMLFRFYGARNEVFTKAWQLDDVVKDN